MHDRQSNYRGQMFVKLPSQDYINLSLVSRVQVMPGHPPIVRVVWSNGHTWVFEREDAIAIEKALHEIPVIDKSTEVKP